MNRQKVFLEMMETLIGKQINFEDVIGQSKDALEENCAKLSSEVGNPFTVDMDNGNEPCPFYCSSIYKPFDFVFIGINPGRALEHHNELGFSWQNTTWQDLVDFCVPISDIRSHEKDIYQFVSKNNVGSDYYNFFLRFHVALTGGDVFNHWKSWKIVMGTQKSFLSNTSRLIQFLTLTSYLINTRKHQILMLKIFLMTQTTAITFAS